MLVITTACATGMPVGAHILCTQGHAPCHPRLIPPPHNSHDKVPLPVETNARMKVLSAAKNLLGHQKIIVNGRRFGNDCTGFVRAAYSTVGINLMRAAQPFDNGVTAIWRFASRHGRIYTHARPVPGDLVFFKETYDRNRDGRMNDGLTHIGLVVSIHPDGTTFIIHRTSRGVVRDRMNLHHRNSVTGPSGKKVNDWLRAAGPMHEPRLTSELFAGYATLLPEFILR